MEGLSREAWDAAAPLFREPGFWESLTGRSPALVDSLTRLGQLREPAALPLLLAFSRHRRLEIAAAARTAVEATLAALEIEQLPVLDSWVRTDLRGYQFDRGYVSLEPEAVADLPFSLAALATFHHSGFVRQAALEKIASGRDGRELPYLLLRLNDWVPPVRQLAFSLTLARAVDSYGPHFIDSLPILERLEARGRADHRLILEPVYDLLRREPNLSHLHRAISSKRPSRRRMAFRIATDGPAGGPAASLRLAARSPDPVLRLKAVRLCPSLPPSIAREIVEALEHDPFMPVRREALTARVEILGETVDELAGESLLDPHASLRHLARDYLGKSPEEYASFYREVLGQADPERVIAAIGGLAETGGKDDGRRIRPFLEDARTRARRAALRACAKLDVEGSYDILLTALASRRPGLSKEASKIWSERARAFDGEPLWRVFSESEHVHVRRKALVVLSRICKWASLLYLLRGVRAEPEDLALQASILVEAWVSASNRSAPRLDDEVRRDILHELEKSSGRLHPEVVNSISLVLNST